MVLEYFKEHQARENELFDKLFQLKTTQMGKVNVVSSEGYITQLVYDVLHHVHAKYASLEIHLELLNVNQIVRQVSDGIAHIGLAYNPPVHADLEVVAQKTEPLMLAVPASLPLTQLKRPVNLNTCLNTHNKVYRPLVLSFKCVVHMLEHCLSIKETL